MASSNRLRDVAELAGVSIGTASNAINNRPNVSPETRARVIDAAITLGYPIKGALGEVPTAGLSVVGLLVKHDVGEDWVVNPFYSRVQLGVANECRRCNLSLMYATVEVDPSNRPLAWPAWIEEQRIDGLILAGTFIEDAVDQIKRKADIPVVLVDSYAPNLSYDSVVIDNAGGSAQALGFLLQRGHTGIGLVGWNPGSPPSIQERYLGYMRALEQSGLTPYVEPSALSRLGGYEATKRLLARAPKVTAVFGGNDDTAIGAMAAARDLGRRIPDDLSVVGFDNIDLAHEVTPALTTVHVHKSWMGTIGVQALIGRARNPGQPRITTVVATDLIIRESVAAAEGREGRAEEPQGGETRNH